MTTKRIVAAEAGSAVCVLLAWVGLLPLAAQDPLKVAPNHYRMVLENPWVRVVRVSYAPHETAPMHNHPQIPTIYVYITDSGPMTFLHSEGLALERRPLTAGGIRFNAGNLERHRVEYDGDIPTSYLRIELKTEPLDRLQPGRDIRRQRETAPPGENLFKTQFANGQVRIIRVICAPGKDCPTSEHPADPALVVAMSAGATISRDTNEANRRTWQVGDVDFSPGGSLKSSQSGWHNAGREAFEMLRLELPSKPAAGL
jgi:hypothetical protein